MERDLDLEQAMLFGLFDQKTWRIRSNLPHWIVLEMPTLDDAEYIAQHFSDVLAAWAFMGTDAYFEIDNELYQATNQGELMQAESPQPLSPLIGGAIKINRQLLDVFGLMLDSSRSIGLVRLSDERQISVSGGANGKFLVGASVEQVTQWKRCDYWHPEDLAEFNKTWRQEMSVGGNQWFEYRYRSFDPLADNPGPHQCDFTFITRYRLIEGPDKTVYHVAENLDMDPIQ